MEVVQSGESLLSSEDLTMLMRCVMAIGIVVAGMIGYMIYRRSIQGAVVQQHNNLLNAQNKIQQGAANMAKHLVGSNNPSASVSDNTLKEVLKSQKVDNVVKHAAALDSNSMAVQLSQLEAFLDQARLFRVNDKDEICKQIQNNIDELKLKGNHQPQQTGILEFKQHLDDGGPSIVGVGVANSDSSLHQANTGQQQIDASGVVQNDDDGREPAGATWEVGLGD